MFLNDLEGPNHNVLQMCWRAHFSACVGFVDTLMFWYWNALFFTFIFAFWLQIIKFVHFLLHVCIIVFYCHTKLTVHL